MTDTQPMLPEAIDIERTTFDEHARDRADTAKRVCLMLLIVDLVLVIATFVLALILSKPLEPWFAGVLIASLPASILISASTMWLPARLQRKHYDSRSRSVWTFKCQDTRHEWRIEGVGAASGWRDINIKCEKLPRNPDTLIGFPKLHVRIDNEQGVLKSGHLQDAGDSTSLFVIDKQGLPIGITIGHIDPRKASQEEPWAIELSLFGDAAVLETLLAWPVPARRNTAEANRQAEPDQPRA